MSKKEAPEPDARIGEAALMSAQTGQQYLAAMQTLSDETMGWAREDRTRTMNTFRPLEDKFVADAVGYASPERKAAAVTEAVADVGQQAALARQASQRNLSAMGVNPLSGRAASEDRRAVMGEALAKAGASNSARRQVEAIGDQKIATALGLGGTTAASSTGLAGMGASTMGSGFAGAMQGYAQEGSLFNTLHQGQMQAWQGTQQMYGGIGGALGSILGAFVSSKEKKTEKRAPAISVLDAVKKMPVEEWEYKAGEGDGGGKRHIGPYAEDFQKETGLGDGKTISIIDAVGVAIGATKELAEKVDALDAKISGEAPAPRRPTQTGRRARTEISLRGAAPQSTNRPQPISVRM